MENSVKAARTSAFAAIFSLFMVLAPAAQADTGVGAAIAAQGNHALQLIKTELKNSIQSWQPALGQLSKPRATAIKTRAQTANGASAAGTSRCAP